MNIALKLALGVTANQLVAEELKTRAIVLEKYKAQIEQEHEKENNK